MELHEFTLETYMNGSGSGYWQGREDSRNLKARFRSLARKRGLTAGGMTADEIEWGTSRAVRDWLNTEHGIEDKEAGMLPLSTIVEMLGEVPKQEHSQPAPPDSPAETERIIPADNGAVERLTLALSATGAKIAMIAGDKAKSSDQKMREICDLDANYWEFDSPRWGTLLTVDAAAIRQTPFWTTDRPKRWAAAAIEYRDRYPDEEIPANLKKWLPKAG